ncbi:MAG: arginyl-tRNA synthetase [Puniceicoccaceae bacterium 5H]|nr:MAG: arginyl-tRNA synthetase [Puniceicoccaceae bacterium 5H]
MEQIAFSPAQVIDMALRQVAAGLENFGAEFDPQVRPADPRHGDFQANGVLPWAKQARKNPRQLGQELIDALATSNELNPLTVQWELAGPGFINFRLTPEFLLRWLETYRSDNALREGAGSSDQGRTVMVDYSSPNTAKEMHVGHIRSTVIGEAVARLLEFCGAKVIRDNHIGDWGTQFGMLIWAVKHHQTDLTKIEEVAELEALYRQGSAHYKSSPEAEDECRMELVKLQQGDPENQQIWQQITDASWRSFQQIYDSLDVHFDEVLGESFYRDKVDRIYAELIELNLAQEDQGALVVFHPEHQRFKTQPFLVRKKDGASNYASTDLATILYRVEHFKADELLYVVGLPQSDHFEQLFLTVQKWFAAKNYPVPEMRHLGFGTVLGEDGKAIRTRSGESVKLRDLLNEAIERARATVDAKQEERPEGERLSDEERAEVARVVGLGAIRYADLSQNRTSDYKFSWEQMLSLEGNTAPYLLYAVARLHSIFRRAGYTPGDASAEQGASAPEADEEIALARKLLAFPAVIEQTRSDLRPHFLCTYLFDLAGVFSTFYNACRVIVDEPDVRARRLMLASRTLTVLETGLHLLGLETLERM